MNNLIESITEMTNIGRAELTFSLSDLKYMVPDTGVCYILALFAIFMMLCIRDDIRSEDRHDQESDIDPK